MIATALLSLLVATAAPSEAQGGDTTVIRSIAPLNDRVATLSEGVALGQGSGSPEYQFTHPSLHTGGNGTVYVVDIADPANVGDFRSIVRQYDRNGKLVRTLGRQGHGPGEYVGGVGDVVELPDGRVVLSDPLGLIVFSPTGKPLARWDAKGPTANIGSQILVDPSGWVCTYGATRSGRTAIPFLYRFKFDGTRVDTVGAPAASFPELPQVGLAVLPFAPRHLVAWSSRGYFVTAYGATYAVDINGQTSRGAALGSACQLGNRVTSIRRDVPAIPLKEAEKDDWRLGVEIFTRAGGGEYGGFTWDGKNMPPTKPAIRDVLVDALGRIWVRLSQEARLDARIAKPSESDGAELFAARRWAEPVIFDVYEPDGRYLSRVRLPDAIGLARRSRGQFAIDRDVLWAVTYDADDVPTIRRYQINWGG